MGAFAGPNISENSLVLALDAANKKSYSQNEFQYSTDIFGWFSGNSGGVTAAIVSRDTISSPIGNTPLKMEVTGNDPHLGSYSAAKWNIAPAANGQTWIVSVYAKANVATTGEILIFGANSSGAAFVNGGWVSLTGTTVSIGTEWTRVQHIHTMNSVDVAFIHTRLDGPNSGGTGQTVWWDGLQVERVPAGTTTPTPFTSSYYGGSVYRDLVGSNNGTLVNYPTYSGSNSGSLVFDGVDDYISFSNSASVQFLNRSPYTLEVWVYLATNPFGSQNYTGIFNREDSSIGSRDGWNLWLHPNSSTTMSFSSERFQAGTNRNVSYGVTNSILNTWQHLCCTYDGTNLILYYNSNLVSSRSDATGNITNTSKTLEIGRRGGGSYFNGKLTGQKIYNKALSAAEIQQNFNATRGRFGI